MKEADIIESLTGVNTERKKSRLPAKLDYYQSVTGLFLGLFIIAHMLFESSILFGNQAMFDITKMFEAKFIFGEGKPVIVSILAFVVFVVFVAHAGLAMRKFPTNYKQYKNFKTNMNLINHTDTKLWFVQAWTGFIMFFAGSIHLYVVMVKADDIGPFASSDRVVSGWFWPLYVILIFVVIFHAFIGLYRLCVKWGWFEGDNAKKSRVILQKTRNIMIALFLILACLSLFTYIKIGIAHKNNIGKRYTPISHLSTKYIQNKKALS